MKFCTSTLFHQYCKTKRTIPILGGYLCSGLYILLIGHTRGLLVGGEARMAQVEQLLPDQSLWFSVRHACVCLLAPGDFRLTRNWPVWLAPSHHQHRFTDSRITLVFGRLKISNLTIVHRFTDSRIHGCLGQKKIRVFSNMANVHRFTDSRMSSLVICIFTSTPVHGFTASRMSLAEKNKSFFSNLANVHGFTDSRMSSLVISIFTSTPVHRFTDSRMSWAEKNLSFFPT